MAEAGPAVEGGVRPFGPLVILLFLHGQRPPGPMPVRRLLTGLLHDPARRRIARPELQQVGVRRLLDRVGLVHRPDAVANPVIAARVAVCRAGDRLPKTPRGQGDRLPLIGGR
jgi:hypothetical protein